MRTARALTDHNLLGVCGGSAARARTAQGSMSRRLPPARTFSRPAAVLCVAYAWLMLAGGCDGSAGGRKNVLLLICDDLRTQLRSYGHAEYMQTPNIDKLAADALVFDRAYTNYPYCAPSRNSFMSGRMPSKTKAWNFIDQ